MQPNDVPTPRGEERGCVVGNFPVELVMVPFFFWNSTFYRFAFR